MAPAEFTATTLYVGRKNHPALGPIEVLGYQNKAVNLARTPNAMVLHIPANLTQDNFLWVGEKHRGILDEMVRLLQPLSQGEGYGGVQQGGAPGAAPVQVFDHDIYTIVLAEDPTKIPAALDRVPPNKRPPLDPGLFEFYAKMYPYHSIVLCCFDNAEAYRANPLLIWYPPPYSDWLVMPALDGHTGGVPDLSAPVATDHWLVFGADDAPEEIGIPIRYWGMNIDPALRAFLPEKIIGLRHTWPAPNGDFALSIPDLLRNDLSGLQRLQPVAR
jgi:hypothetical protein